jgi:hypothetical protein
VQQVASLYASAPVSSLSKKEPTEGNGFVGSKLAEAIRTINECYPEEIVRYYSPGYSATLLAKIDDYAAAATAQSTAVPTAEVVAKNSRSNLTGSATMRDAAEVPSTDA